MIQDILIAVVPSTISALVTYFLTKRKYNAEVDSAEIANLKESLAFYKEIVEDNQRKLEEYLKVAKENQKEIYRLRVGIQELLQHSCVDTKCRKRKPIPEEEATKYLTGDEA